ncbi:hypothetical protein WN944_003912 [Citrus x changshan-huyou]|uniref:DUF8039 domain-containing protein n=1 Tax=Citrus x changshan-huyou TaxID=2935761 RepID=A0AAP0QHC0_9ROSI
MKEMHEEGLHSSAFKSKNKRGHTKLKNIAVDGDKVEVIFNSKGQPIGEGSISLSSFLGPLVREHVPYTISDWRKLPLNLKEVLWECIKKRYKLDGQWQRAYVFQEMAGLWRASKSRLVQKILQAKNEQERMKLRPDNISSINEWKSFVKEKTSENFKERSEGFKKIRKKQIPQTTGRRGLARMTEDMKKSSGKTEMPRVDVWIRAHTKKDGQPVNIQAGETIDKLKETLQDPSQHSSNNLRDDALSQSHFHETEASGNPPKTPLTSPMSVKPIPNITKCKMLDLEGSDTVVAEGRWSSSDPNALVHHIPLGSNAIRVWVDIARQPLKFLWKVTPYMTTIEESVGSTIAWPADRVILFTAN